MENVLLIDTNYSAAPIYDYLIKSGYKVYVCGSNPHDFLAKVASNYLNIDYSDTNRLLSEINLNEIDYIIPGCNDQSYEACARINFNNNYYGIDALSTTTTINNKANFRAIATQLGLSIPRVISASEASDIWPLVVKPVDAYSGRGITIVQEKEKDKLTAAIILAKEFSKSDACIIEEFVDGQLYSHSAFLSGDKIVAEFVVEEHGSANPFVVDTSRVIDNFSPGILQRIRTEVILMADHLEMVNGLIHTQFIVKDLHFWIIEITRRCPGDLYSLLIEKSTGYNYAKAFTKPFLNKKLTANNETCKSSHILRHTISQSHEMQFKSIKFNTFLNVDQYVPLCLTGDIVKESPFGRIGLIFLKTASEHELSVLMNKTLMRKIYTIC